MDGKVQWVTARKINATLFENISVFILIRAMHGLQLVEMNFSKSFYLNNNYSVTFG